MKAISRSLTVLLGIVLNQFAVPSLAVAQRDIVPPRGVVIIDGSGSMWGRIANDLEKISAVHQALPDKVAALKGQADLGLIAYGHRRRRDCRDVETLVPVGPLDPEAFSTAIRHLLPRGKTPITSALQQAVEALGPKHDGPKSRILLVADGNENCNLDPCAYARETAASRPDIIVDVIAIGVSAKEETELQCIAAPSQGSYRRVEDVQTLAAAFGAVFEGVQESARPSGEPGRKKLPPGLYLGAALAADADALADGVSWRIYSKGESSATGATPLKREAAATPVLQLENGSYHVEARYGPLLASADVDVEAGAAQQQKLSFDAGVVTGDARLGGETAAGDDVVLTLYSVASGEPGPDDILGHRRKHDAVFYLSPGRYSLRARLGEAEVRKDFDLQAGERKTLPLPLDAGELALSARLSAGGPLLPHAEYTIYRREAAGDAVYSEFLRTLDAAPKLVLPAGDYLVHAVDDAASVSVPVSLAAGESKVLALDLDAAVLTLSAQLGGGAGAQQQAHAFSIEPVTPITSTTVRLAGNRTRALEPSLPSSSSRSRFVLPAGDYRIRTRFGNSNAVSEAAVALAAGEEKAFVAEVSAGQLQPVLVVRPGDPPLPGVFWSVVDAEGRQVASASRASPRLILRDGSYALVADYLGKTYRQEVSVRAGEDRKIELKVE